MQKLETTWGCADTVMAAAAFRSPPKAGQEHLHSPNGQRSATKPTAVRALMPADRASDDAARLGAAASESPGIANPSCHAASMAPHGAGGMMTASKGKHNPQCPTQDI